MLNAQVTIGSDIEPNQGALLDLKEKKAANPSLDNTTSTKGLGMPRVRLTSPTSIAADIAGVTDMQEDKDAHTGLMVYNVDKCSLHGSGLYVWDGTQWSTLFSPVVETDLGTGVIEHPAKVGVYAKFTSASFGTAGRWMTTNLAATAYDSEVNTATLPLTPTSAATDDQSVPQWGYPNATSAITSTDYEAKPELGFLYNWAAALATTQKNNATNEAGTSYSCRQGICPNGWHLPSDLEWTELEDVIIQHTSLYSSMQDINPTNPNTLLMTENRTSWFGMHGKAMKVNTVLNGTDANGASNAISANGFAVLLAGHGGYYNSTSISAERFGLNAYFWTSSSFNSITAINRALWTSTNGVQRGVSGDVWRSYLYSVRCKKN